MTPYEIPLSPEPQTLTVALAGVTYQLLIVWNKIGQCWVLDIADAGGNPLVQGIQVVTGLNLLMQYEHLGFVGGMLVAQTDFNPNAVPTYANLGITGRLWFVTN